MPTAERIRDAMRAQPFQPFDLVLADGRRYTITHPDYISVPPAQRPRDIVFYTEKPVEPGEFQTRWINLGLVAELVVPAETTTRSTPHSEGNGA
jgi:hypothetical protein